LITKSIVIIADVTLPPSESLLGFYFWLVTIHSYRQVWFIVWGLGCLFLWTFLSCLLQVKTGYDKLKYIYIVHQETLSKMLGFCFW